jgi:class 3 adenylate cyclase/tetratricopeptide (TPR) repeat protein
MRCSQCGAISPTGNKFCGVCGFPLAAACPACAKANPPGMKFCGECGTPLLLPGDMPSAGGRSITDWGNTSPPVSTPAVEVFPSGPGQMAQRRVCSVLFCDLVGFTPLSEARDPEEVRELLSRYFEVARTVIDRYGGVVEKFIGDAVMAVWGTPTATEEDAERAVRAALDLIDAVAQLGQEVGAEGLAARAGVVTGPVAVTVGATGEGMVAGDAVNTAARVQTAAEAGSVLVDEGTWQVARAAIDFTSVGTRVLKGKAEPVALWMATHVVAGAGGSQRIDGLEAGFIGRDAELRLVKELFHVCEQRRTPRLVSVTGAAGVGKTRVAWEFEKYIDGLADTVRWHRGRCLSYGEGVAFWALAEMVRQRLKIAEEDSSAVAGEKLVAGIERWLANPDERAYVGPRLAQLLGVDYSDAAPMLGREELFAGWRLFFERLAASGPVVMVVEDLQYGDIGLLDFLEHLLDWARDVPIFVLTLARPELEGRRPGWGTGRRHSTALTLDPLVDAAMETLLDALVPGMPTAAKAAIAAQAEGIPLYAVETVRMLIDRDIVQPIDGVYRLVGDVGELAVPATLQSLLAARLDALDPDARSLIADAAVLGSTFPAEALIAVSDQPEPRIRRLLTELVHREVLGVRADPLDPQRGQYAFVQTMFRQVAYDTLSRRERKARHLAVAAHLRSAFADEGEEIAEVIAAHLSDALTAVPDDPDVPELRAETVEMLTRAGERAERTGAPETAADAYTAAANLLQETGGAGSELGAAALRERAGKAVEFADFQAAVEHFEHAADLYLRHDRIRDAARASTGIGGALQRQGRHAEARSVLLKSLAVLEPDPGPDTVDALAVLGRLEAFAGNIAEADRLSAAALGEAQALGLSDSIMAELFTNRGLAHVFANRLAQAVASYREAVRRAQAANVSQVSFRALANLAEVLLATDPQAALESARESVALGRHMGSRQLLGVAQTNAFQALLLTGAWDEAERELAAWVAADGIGADPVNAYCAVLLRSFRGDRNGVQAVLPLLQPWRDTEAPQELSYAATSFAAAAMADENHTEALAQAERALSYTDALGFGAEAIRWAWPMAADSALALKDHDTASRLVNWLGEYPPGHIPPLLRAERQRIEARLLAASGDPAAQAAFERATSAFRRLGSPYHLAVELLDEAEHTIDSEDSRRAQQLTAEAAAIAERLGAQPLIDKAQHLANDLPPASEGTVLLDVRRMRNGSTTSAP